MREDQAARPGKHLRSTPEKKGPSLLEADFQPAIFLREKKGGEMPIAGGFFVTEEMGDNHCPFARVKP